MFADEIRRAAEAAPRVKLPEVAVLLWKAFGAGQVTEAEAEELSGLIELRKVAPSTPIPAPRRVGSRPRSAASIERRRRWAASGALPVGLAAQFTLAEQAALAIVAEEVVRHGRCTLCIGAIAGKAGVGETSVRNAIREAKRLGLVTIEVRRVAMWRNLPNVVTIVSPEWSTWLKHGRGGSLQIREGLGFSVWKEDGLAAVTRGIRGKRRGHRPPRATVGGGYRPG